MKITDISGPVFSGMWTYGGPYGEVEVAPIPPPDFVEHTTYSWHMNMSVQSGTYLETSRHLRLDGPALIEVPLEEVWMRECAILRVPKEPNEAVTRKELEDCGVEVRPGDAVIVATGWDAHWRESDFVSDCPWFLREAMDWILDREPSIVCGDTPRFDSWEQPQGFWDRFFSGDTLLLAPVVNLSQVKANRVRLCALPMKLEDSCAAPCRAIVIED